MASVVVSGLPVCAPRDWPPLSARYRRVNDTLNLIGLTIFIIGQFWLADTQTCAEHNPAVFHLTFILIVVAYTLLLLPCGLLLCLAPCVFCCLPLLIRLSRYLPAGMGLRVSGQHGATESLIEKLPPPRTFERGMFGSRISGTDDAADTEARGTNGSNSPTAVNHDEPEW